MKKNISSFSVLCVLGLFIILSGCEMIFRPIIYEASPTKISYDISYGFHVNITGTGRYEIIYLCDTPKVLVGLTNYSVLYNNEYLVKKIFNNTIIHWNISGKYPKIYELGITAKITAENYLIADLNGENALTITQINNKYPNLTTQYTRLQANETIRFIDPYDPNITTIAKAVYTNASTNNSFKIAKSLFSWLKQNIAYQIHPDERVVRSASITLDRKQGDCDDLSFLYISLCRALDIPARFIRGYLVSDSINGSIIATPHAWTEVFVGKSVSPNGWIPIECACCTNSITTDINQNFGVESSFHLRLFTDDGSNASLASSLSEISYITHEPNIKITLQSFAEISNYQELASKKLVITENNNRYYE